MKISIMGNMELYQTIIVRVVIFLALSPIITAFALVLIIDARNCQKEYYVVYVDSKNQPLLVRKID